MSKKHWIYLKRGLSEDPKHRAQMGECVWLFMHIVDRADWETGIAYDWKDREEADAMGMPVETLRHQRQKLDGLDYIRCKQNQHSQDISIMEWRNPRDYGSEIKNPRVQGSNEQLPSEEDGNFQGSNQGDNQGSNQVQAGITTPTLDSKIIDHRSLPHGVGLDWKLGHNQPIEDMDEETQFLYPARDRANLIATGRPVRYEYAMSYMLATHTIPTEKQIKHWRKTMDEWLDIKPACPTPADVTARVLEHLAKELSFSGPHSFTYLFQGKNNGHDAKGNQKSADSRQGRQDLASYSASDLAAADRINKRANGG